MPQAHGPGMAGPFPEMPGLGPLETDTKMVTSRSGSALKQPVGEDCR